MRSAHRTRASATHTHDDDDDDDTHTHAHTQHTLSRKGGKTYGCQWKSRTGRLGRRQRRRSPPSPTPRPRRPSGCSSRGPFAPTTSPWEVRCVRVRVCVCVCACACACVSAALVTSCAHRPKKKHCVRGTLVSSSSCLRSAARCERDRLTEGSGSCDASPADDAKSSALAFSPLLCCVSALRNDRQPSSPARL
jgi:hypothetical protein